MKLQTGSIDSFSLKKYAEAAIKVTSDNQYIQEHSELEYCLFNLKLRTKVLDTKMEGSMAVEATKALEASKKKNLRIRTVLDIDRFLEKGIGGDGAELAAFRNKWRTLFPLWKQVTLEEADSGSKN